MDRGATDQCGEDVGRVVTGDPTAQAARDRAVRRAEIASNWVVRGTRWDQSGVGDPRWWSTFTASPRGTENLERPVGRRCVQWKAAPRLPLRGLFHQGFRDDGRRPFAVPGT